MAATRVDGWTFDPNSSTATWNIPLTGRGLQADDIILVWVASLEDLTSFTGYQRIFPPTHSGWPWLSCEVLWRRADGNETQASLTFNAATDGIAQVQIWRGAANPCGAGPQNVINANKASFDPRPYLGQSDSENVWLTGVIRRETVGVSGWPTGYGNTLESINNDGSFGGRSISTAYKVATTGVEDPSAFTHNATRVGCWTICIPPAAPPAGPYRVSTRDWIPPSGQYPLMTAAMPIGDLIQAGDVIVVAFSGVKDNATNPPTASGYTAVAGGFYNGTSDHYGALFCRVADGSETQFALSWSGAAWTYYGLHLQVWRNVAATLPTASRVGSNASSANGNPPSHTAASAGTHAWLAFVTRHVNDNLVTAAPAGYSDLYNRVRSTATYFDSAGDYGAIAVAHKISTDLTEDPGAFTHSASMWNAFTLEMAVATAGGGGGGVAAMSGITDITGIA